MKPPTYQQLIDVAIWLGNEAERCEIGVKALTGTPNVDMAPLRRRAAAFRYASDCIDFLAARANQMGLLLPGPTRAAFKRPDGGGR